jgi:hypothetical protein
VPIGLTAEPGNTRVDLKWDGMLGATSYNVYRSSASGTLGTLIASPTDSNFIDLSVINGNVYFYQVSSINTGGESAPSSSVKVIAGGVAWVKTGSETPDTDSRFSDLALDGAGNVYAVGSLYGAATYAPGVTASTVDSRGVLVKYDADGSALWVKTPNSSSWFWAVCIDASGNVYAVGEDDRCCATVAKFDGNGVLEWQAMADKASTFYGVSVDDSGNIYAAGYQNGGSTVFYGPSVSAETTCMSAVVVKFDTTGVALWARTPISPSRVSEFNGIALDASGDVYVAGYQYFGAFNYGPGVEVTGSGESSSSSVLVKYDSDGVAQWARVPTSGAWASRFNDVVCDASGNVFVAGCQENSYSYGIWAYGPYVTAVGTSYNTNSSNAVVVKYSTSGVAEWAKTVDIGPDLSTIEDVSVDESGNVYIAGYMQGSGTFVFGPDTFVAGTSASRNLFVVKYNVNGSAQWARTVECTGSCDSNIHGIVTRNTGSIYAVGILQGAGTYRFGPGVSTNGTAAYYNAFLLRYEQ